MEQLNYENWKNVSQTLIRNLSKETFKVGTETLPLLKKEEQELLTQLIEAVRPDDFTKAVIDAKSNVTE